MTAARLAWTVAAVLLALFLLDAILVARGATQSFDGAVLAALRQPLRPGSVRGPHWLFALAAHLTVLGSFPVRAALAVAGAFLLWRHDRRRAALALVVAVTLGVPLIEGLKAIFARARPDLAFRLVAAGHASFPSGHAAGSMILFPLGGWLIGSLRGGGSAAVGLGIGIALAVVIGLTRVLLGVHWMSDVLGGWLLGGGVAFVAATFAAPAVPEPRRDCTSRPPPR